MPQAGHCTECGQTVWLEANGTCPAGHGREAISSSWMVEDPTIVRKGVPTLLTVVLVVAMLVGGLAFGYATGRKNGSSTGYKTGLAAGTIVGDKAGYERGHTEGFSLGLKTLKDASKAQSESLVQNDYPMKANSWMLIKVSKKKSGDSMLDIAGWQVEKQFSDLTDGKWRIQGDSLYSIGDPAQDW